MKKHFVRQTPCPPLNSDESCELLLEQLTQRSVNEVTYDCEYCKRKFNNRPNLSRHRKVCKKRENEQADIEALKEQVKKLTDIVNSLPSPSVINNNTNNNTQVININIERRDFARNENTSYLDKELLFECFRDMNLPKVLGEIHFNPEHPENHNVKIKNLKQNLMQVIDNGEWVISKKEEVLSHLIMNGWRVLHTYYKKNKSDIQDEMLTDEVDDSVTWLQKIYNEDKELMKELKDDVCLLIMNNKAMLIKPST